MPRIADRSRDPAPSKALLDHTDHDVYEWIVGGGPAPDPFETDAHQAASARSTLNGGAQISDHR